MWEIGLDMSPHIVRSPLNTPNCAPLPPNRPPLPFLHPQDGRTPLHYATWEGHTDLALELVGRGANLEATNIVSQGSYDREGGRRHNLCGVVR